MSKFLVMTAVAVLVAGCANTGVMTRENGQFFIAKADAHLGASPAGNLRRETMAEAAAHCAKEGKTAETVKLEDNTAGQGGPAAVALTFKCVAKR